MGNTNSIADDPLLAEIREFRAEFSRRFSGDIKAMSEEMRRQAAASGRPGINRPPKRSKGQPRPFRPDFPSEQNCESVTP